MEWFEIIVIGLLFAIWITVYKIYEFMKKDEPDEFYAYAEKMQKLQDWYRVKDDPAAAQRFRDAEKNRTQI